MKKHSKIKKASQVFKYKKLDKDLIWYDAISDTGWLSEEDMEKQKPAVAVSSQMWVFKENEDFITLFGTYSIDEKGKCEFGEIITIPKKWM
jgi:hypothetical protein